VSIKYNVVPTDPFLMMVAPLENDCTWSSSNVKYYCDLWIKMKSVKMHQRSSSIPSYIWRTLAWFHHQDNWRAQTDSNKPSRAEALREWALASRAEEKERSAHFSCSLQLFAPATLEQGVCTQGGSANTEPEQDWALELEKLQTRRLPDEVQAEGPGVYFQAAKYLESGSCLLDDLKKIKLPGEVQQSP
jgi:hypothetical protein